MERYFGTTQFQIQDRTAAAIGKFDGVHLGHQMLLQEVLARKESGLKACVFTFDPSPAAFFGYADGRELMTLEEKRRMFAQMGVDILIEYPLNAESASMEPSEFVRRILIKQMRAGFLAAGSDLSFGKGGKGSWELLKQMQEEGSYTLKEIPKVRKNGEVISSTGIRGMLEAGRMEQVAECLGRPYSVSGRVAHGKELGRTIGFPTANLPAPEGKILPPYGVYASVVRYGGTEYLAISNVGEKPTVSQEKTAGIETYLYDFDADLYGEEITVEFLAFHRPEQRFASLEALRKQLEQDILTLKPKNM